MSFFLKQGPIKYEWFLNRSICLINSTLTGTHNGWYATTPRSTLTQSVSGSDSNKGLHYTPQISKTGASLSDAMKCHNQDKNLLKWGLTLP